MPKGVNTNRGFSMKKIVAGILSVFLILSAGLSAEGKKEKKETKAKTEKKADKAETAKPAEKAPAAK